MLTVLFFVVCMCTSTLCQVSDVGCGVTKSCWKWPNGCALTDASCRFVSWNESATDNFFFEMRSNEASGRYHAFGIARAGAMPNADIYICRENGMLFGSTTARAAPPLEAATAGITEVSAAMINGSLQCTFTRVQNITRDISGSQTHNFDLVENRYFIIMSVGATSGNSISYHENNNRISSPSNFNFSELLLSPAVTTQTVASATTAASTQAVNISASTPAVITSVVTPSNDNTTSTPMQITKTGCKNTKECYSNANDCDLKSKECRFISWRKVGSYFEIEMSGSKGNGDEYIAMAFGTTNLMQDADAYICTGQTLTSAVITTRQREPTYLDPGIGIMELVQASTINNVANCVFRRPVAVTKAISTDNRTFDLSKTEYYLLVATGATNGMKITQHNWRIAVPDKINFTKVSSGVNLFPSKIVLLGLLGITLLVQSRFLSQL